MTDRRAFIRQIGLSGLGLGFSRYGGMLGREGEKSGLPRSAPEEQGIDAAGISDFIDAIGKSKQEFHSLMILRHGKVVAEGWWTPYTAERKQQLYSLSKSFTGTAIGLAAQEGLLSIEDPILKFYPHLQPANPDDNLVSLKIKHLLSMSVGHAKDAILLLEASAPGVPWEKTFLDIPVVNKPGTRFLYNSGASFMLSSIIKQVTGISAHAYLKPRLYDPLRITGATWTENFEGINMGASHLRIHTEDIAKFGQLYLQKGLWNGKRILDPDWVASAGNKQIESGNRDSSWGFGYGFQFWMNPPGGFRADGAFGQYSMILPEQDAVVAITSESVSTKDTMQLVWDRLLPLMGNHPLPKNAAAGTRLREKLNGLHFDPPFGAAHSLLEKKITGKEYALDKNPFNAKSVLFEFSANECIFILKEEGKADIRITNGINRWAIGDNFKPTPHSLFSLRRIDFDSAVAASAGWIDERTLLLSWRFIETVHGDSLTCIFDEDRIRIRFLFSVNRLQGKPDDREDILGRQVA